MTDEKPARVVIRFVLAPSKDERIKNQIGKLSDRLRSDELTEHDRNQLANVLDAIANGRSAEKIFQLSKNRGGQPKTRLHKWMAIDFWLRFALKHEKIRYSVTFDWNEISSNTVKDIARRNRKQAEATIQRWRESAPLELYLDAVADVREQLLHNKKLPPTNTPEETIDLRLVDEEAICGPPELNWYE